MLYSQYCRIEKRAGGIGASPRQMIRAARTLLSKKGTSRSARNKRHFWYTEILVLHQSQKDFVKTYRL